MKSYLMPFFVFVLIFMSCSQDNIIDPGDNSEFIIKTRYKVDCVEYATCDDDYSFRLENPAVGYDYFTVTFAATSTSEEIYCLRQAYFKCYNLLCLSVFQDKNLYEEIWCYPSGKPGTPLSDTIDTDPRVEAGG